MKRIFLMMLAVAGMAATSCERSFDEGVAAAGNEAKVSVNIEFPAMQTRAYSDGTTATELQYAVFEKKNDVLTKIDTYTKKEEIKISKQVEFQLVTGRTYQFVFWAAAPSESDWTNPYTVAFDSDGATMTVDYSKILANDERNDAFFASVEKKITGDVQMSVELTRPFAQINVGTSDYEVAKAQGCAPTLSQIVLNNAYTTLDLVTGVASGENKPTTFKFNNIDSKEKFPIDNYEYLAMTYVLASEKEQADYTVTFSYKEGADGEVTDRTVGSVPVQRNHRTNMFGQVLTSTAAVNVIIVPEYEEPDHNYSQLLFAAAVGGTAVMEDDVTLPDGKNITFTRDAVVDMNGKTVTGTVNGVFTAVGEDTNLTIKGNGTMNSTNEDADILVWADNGATITIEDGTFNGQDDEMIYIGAGGGTIYIKGGTFKCDDFKYTLNCYDAAAKNEIAKFVVTGGKFWKFDPSASAAEGTPIRNWVPAGYKSVKTTIDGDENWYVVVPEGTTVANAADAQAAISKGGSVYLTEDVTITAKIAMARAAVVNFGGKTITNQTAGGDAIQLGGGDFTFMNGKIDNSVGGGETAGIYANSSKGNNITIDNMEITATYPIYLNNAVNPECVIKSGTFTSPYDKGVAVYVQKGGHAIIEGGFFTTDGHDSTYLLNLQDDLVKGKSDVDPRTFIEVKGGTFVNFDPSASMGEPAPWHPCNFVADGYKVVVTKVGNDTHYTVVAE